MATEEPQEIDVEILKGIAKKNLIDALNSVNGAKTLVLDATLAGPLGLVTEVALLKHHGVDKMFWLEKGPLTPSTTNIVYLCRPLIINVKIIAEQVRRHGREGHAHIYTLLMVPRATTLVRRILEEEGVAGDVAVSEYALQFISLAKDVLSLEHENAFKELWVDGDESVIYDSAQALVTLQKLYGTFPRIVGKGTYAKRLATLVMRSAPSAPSTETILPTSTTFDSLIIIDRRVDMITPLLTQLTYEGLIDEVIGIKNSHVELPASLLATPASVPSTSVPVPSTSGGASTLKLKKEAKKKHHLTIDIDPLFAELRDANFSSVGRKLNKVARRLDEDYKTNLQSKTVAQLRDFVGKLGGLQTEHQSLRLHTGLSELIVPFTRTEIFNKSLEIQQNLLASYEVASQVTAVEGLIAQGADIQTVVRLLCLASITSGGIKMKTLESIKHEILQAYGYGHLPLLLALGTPALAMLLPTPLPAGAVWTAGNGMAIAKYPFAAIRKGLRLLVEDTPEGLEEVENDVAYVYSGYAPVSVRLVQCIAQKGGVLSNPAIKERGREREREESDKIDASIETEAKMGTGKVQAHPIVGWKGFEDVVALIPGETFDIMQPDARKENAHATPEDLERGTTTAVFFLGGCTYTEIAALRWLGRQNRGARFLQGGLCGGTGRLLAANVNCLVWRTGRQFLVATTGMVTGATIVNGMDGGAGPGNG